MNKLILTNVENNIEEVLNILKEYTEKFHKKNEQIFVEKSRVSIESSLVFFKILILQRFYDLEFNQLFYLLMDRTSFKKFINQENLPPVETIVNYKEALQMDQFLVDIFQEIEFWLHNNDVKINRGKCLELSIDKGLSGDINGGKCVDKGMVSEICLKNYAHPLLLRMGTTDFDVYAEVINQEMYRLDLHFTPEFIIDCGANIGLASIFFKKQYPESLIISVEPENSNYAILEKNTYPYLPEIIPLQGAVWNRKTELSLYNGPDKGHWGFMVDENTDAELGKIRTFTLKEIMDKYNKATIDILKIDIEGAEKELFEHDYEYWLSRTKVLLIETHDRIKEGCSSAVLCAMSNYNFKMDIRGNTLIFTKI